MHNLHARSRQMDLCEHLERIGASDQEYFQALGRLVRLCAGMRVVQLRGCLVSRSIYRFFEAWSVYMGLEADLFERGS
jgi:hypothetical protein